MSTSPKHLPPEALNEWLDAAAAELGLEPDSVDIKTVLDVARDVAHHVARPAAPLSTFLLGLAVGRAVRADGDPERELPGPAERLTDLALGWDADQAG